MPSSIGASPSASASPFNGFGGFKPTTETSTSEAPSALGTSTSAQPTDGGGTQSLVGASPSTSASPFNGFGGFKLTTETSTSETPLALRASTSAQPTAGGGTQSSIGASPSISASPFGGFKPTFKIGAPPTLGASTSAQPTAKRGLSDTSNTTVGLLGAPAPAFGAATTGFSFGPSTSAASDGLCANKTTSGLFGDTQQDNASGDKSASTQSSFGASPSRSASPFGGFKPTTGTSTFGAPPASGASTSEQPTAGGGLSDTSNTTEGLLGAPAPAFGAATTGFSFGPFTSAASSGLCANKTTSGLFGDTQQDNAFGDKSASTQSSFGASPSRSASPFGGFKPTTGTSTFGAPPALGASTSAQPTAGGDFGFGFGSIPTNQNQTAGFFGNTTMPGSGLFGQLNTTFSSGGGFGQQQQAPGTGHVKYCPVLGTDVVVKFGTEQNINIKHHCITGMKEYEWKSLEELRLEDYTAGRKGSSRAMFPFQQQQPAQAKPVFGGTSFGFGFGSTPTNQNQTSGFYKNTTTPGSGLFGQPLGGGSIFSNTIRYGGFGQQQQAPGTGHVRYCPVVGTDVVVKFGTTQNVNIKHHCITCMKEYEWKSLEELRLEDYTAGRKGGSGAMFPFQQQQPAQAKPVFGGTSFGFGFGSTPTNQNQTSGFFGNTTTPGSGLFGQPNTTLGGGDLLSNTAVPRSSCSSGTPNDLPPLSFHNVHGENVRISRDGFTARRVESFSKGVVFSARPVRVDEKVCIRFVDISNSWSGVIRFGFTTHDPNSIAHSLPKYDCPDLTNKPGYWAQELWKSFFEKDNVLHYYVNAAGDVHFKINGQEKGLFFSGVDTRNPIWALVDVYGRCTAVQLADPRSPSQFIRANHSPDEEDRLVTGMRSVTVDEPLPAPRYQNPLVPLSLHRTKGQNINYISDRGVVARMEGEYSQGYVFTARPMRPGQTIVVQILATNPAYSGSLAIGLTSCDPATIRPSELPPDIEFLLDRQEYWVVHRDAANGLCRGDELAVTLTIDGEVLVSRNGSNPITVMHVDHTLRLWAFVDLYGATQKIRMLSSQTVQAQTPQQLEVIAGSAPIQTGAGGTVLVVRSQNAVNHQQTTLASAHIEPIQSSQICLSSLQPMTSQPSCSSLNQPTTSRPRTEAKFLSANQNALNEQDQIPNDHAEPLRSETINERVNEPVNERMNINASSISRSQHFYSVVDEDNLAGSECTICYENPIDSVLYMCGHMCMCYTCSLEQWQGKGDGQCPLCRAQIRDVIRAYKS